MGSPSTPIPMIQKKAVLTLNNYQIRKGRYLGVVLSVDNDRLFIGGVPREMTKDELRTEIGLVSWQHTKTE